MIRQNSKKLSYINGTWPLDLNRLTLLFIHGASSSSMLWEEQIQGLCEYANTIAIDLPGHGYSKGYGCDRIQKYGQEIIEFVQELKLQNVVLCGLSMGGAIVMQLLIDCTNTFKAGILVGTGARLRVMPELIQTIENDYPEYIEMVKKIGFSEKTDHTRVARITEEMAKCKPSVAKKDFVSCDNFDVMKQLHVINVPVLVVTGQDDVLTPTKYGDFLQRSIKNSYRAHIADVGHHIPAENPDAFNKAVLDFIKNLNF